MKRADRRFALKLLATVVKILSALPENTTELQIQQLFPAYQIKPIDRDPTCWKRLQEIAAQVEKGHPVAKNSRRERLR